MEAVKNECICGKNCPMGENPSQSTDLCYPYILLYGLSGKGGFWWSSGVPKKYKDRKLSNLNIIEKQNPQAYQVASMYGKNILEYVNDGVGLFLYSIPNADNKMGTGTGKTTVATTLINEYIIARVKQHTSGGRRVSVLPAYFLRASEFQNTFNSQFRGTEEMRIEATEKYYRLKNLMLNTELLVIDDISLRNSTEALTNELYEIFDERSIEEKSTIFTSNQPIEKVGEMLSEQIASRIAGMSELVGFYGKDNRKIF